MRNKFFSKYFIALLIIITTAAIQKLIWPLVDPAPYLLFYPAIILCALFGDGVVSVILSAIVIQYLFIPPYYSLEVNGPGDVIRMLVFMISAYIMTRIIRSQIDEKHKARTAVSLLKKREKDLEVERETRERFVATLTHDLQTPLTAIMMNLQLLNRMDGLTDKMKNYVTRSHKSLKRMQNMIQDLLDVNSIRAGKPLPLEIGECEMEVIIQETVADLIEIYGERFAVQGKGNFHGHWSCKGIRRIIENLCTNAVKYGTAEDPIIVGMKRDGDSALLSVTNKGPVIPPETQKVLFDPFERASEQGGSKKGWGLGLTLVKGLTEAQGGTVSVESSAEKGTIFKVQLPLDARQYVTEKVLS